MSFYHSASVLLLLFGHCAVHSANTNLLTPYDYTSQGTDWTETEWKCLSQSSQSQSPADLPTNSTAAADKELQLISIGGYDNFVVTQDLHSIRVAPEGQADRLSIDGVDYILTHYEIRGPSEHKLDGVQAALEVQLYFETVRQVKAVMSFLYNAVPLANDAPFLYFLESIAEMTNVNNAERSVTPVVDNRLDMFSVTINWLIQNDYAYLLTYDGTVTTPPCADPVTWFVYDKALPAPRHLLNAVAAKVSYSGTKGNYRATPTENQSAIAVQKYHGPAAYGVYLSSGAFNKFGLNSTGLLLLTVCVLCVLTF